MMAFWKDQLRARAAKALAEHQHDLGWRRRGDIEQVYQELEIHNVELEIQNQQLRNTEASLEIERNRYLALFEDAPVALLQVDDAGTIVEANRRALELFEEAGSAVVGATLGRFARGEQVEAIERCRRMLTEGERFTTELTLVVGGRERVVQVSSVAGSGHGGDHQLALVDLTEMRFLEAQVAQSQKLEAMAMAMSGIAHDFNNLLFGIGGCADLALQMVGDEN